MSSLALERFAIEGCLEKKGQLQRGSGIGLSLGDSWKERYFTFDAQTCQLKYFRSGLEIDSQPLGAVEVSGLDNLDHYQGVANHKPHRFDFLLADAARGSLAVSAPTAEHRAKWLRIVASALRSRGAHRASRAPAAAVAREAAGTGVVGASAVEGSADAASSSSTSLHPSWEPEVAVGRAAMAKGKWVDAAECFRRGTQLVPRAPEPWLWLGALYEEELHDPTQAEAHYRSAVRQRADHAPSAYRLGRLLLHTADPATAPERVDEAEKQLRAAIRADGEYAPAHVALGALMWGPRSNAAAAEAAFRAALHLDPTLVCAYEQLGLLVETVYERAAEAERLYSKAVALGDSGMSGVGSYGGVSTLLAAGGLHGGNAPSGLAHARLGGLRWRRDAKGAEALLRRALELDGDIAPAHLHLGMLLWHGRRDTKGAEAALKRAAELDPDCADALVARADLVLEARGDVEAAQPLYRRAIAADSSAAEPHYRLGLLLHSQEEDQGVWAEAEDQFAKASELDPAHADAQYWLGRLREEYHRAPREAEGHYRRALEIDGTHADAHFSLGRVLYNTHHDFDEAEAHYRRALELEPKHAEALNNLGVLLKNAHGDWPGAEAQYRAAIAVDPKYAHAHLNLGVLLKNGPARDAAAAEKCYRRAVELAPDEPWARYNLGVLLKEKGDLAGAEQSFRRFVEVAPQEGDGPKALAELEALRAAAEAPLSTSSTPSEAGGGGGSAEPEPSEPPARGEA
eukprot:g1816.t1